MGTPLIYAVLNWGLGHASRSVPMIEQLQQLGYVVHIASSGDAGIYLRREFPACAFLELPDYKVTYPTQFMALNALMFGPAMWRAIRVEKQRVNTYASQHDIRLCFSDNRYGCTLNDGKNFFIGHQLKVKTGSSFTSSIVNHIQQYFLRDFQAILVPDFRQIPNLSGSLSHIHTTSNVHFIGPLSSYHKPTVKPTKYRWCCILSGVEPQRSHLEKKLFHLLEEQAMHSVIISGKENPAVSTGKYVKVLPLLNRKEVQEYVDESEFLCLRSGYSSLMDLSVWRKPALLIPTPGQAEQEYLADYLAEKFYISTVKQATLSAEQLNKTPHSTDSLPDYDENMLERSLGSILQL